MDIVVIGAGYVGLVAAACLAYSGHRVVAVEKNLDKLNRLQHGDLTIYEEGLEDIFQKAISCGRLTFTHDRAEALTNATMVLVAVGTPSLPDGKVDLSQVNQVVQAIARFAERPLTVIMKSTVPPGTGKLINDRLFSKSGIPIRYVSNPEFLREGKAVWDWQHPDRVVIGSDDTEAIRQVMELYSNIDAPKVCMDITSAEMVKYASNAFLATKISFINEIANLCERVGADIDSVASTVGMDKRIGPHFLKAGLGYGGSCFPKDTRGLDYISVFNGYNFSLLKAVIEVNAKQRILAVRKLLQSLDTLIDKRIAVLGLAFKPYTDDIREAPALDIIEQLISEGAQVTACDPMAIENARQKLGQDTIEFYLDPYQACERCSAVILATEWPDFIALDWGRIKQVMKTPYVLFDGRNALNKETMMDCGFLYLGIGRLTKGKV